MGAVGLVMMSDFALKEDKVALLRNPHMLLNCRSSIVATLVTHNLSIFGALNQLSNSDGVRVGTEGLLEE